MLAGRYQLLSPLGTGGSGTVYLARDTLLNSELCAVKLLHPHLSSSEKHIECLRNEVRLAQQLVHPGIVRVRQFDVTSFGDLLRQYFIVLEYVEGRDLRSFIEESSSASVEALQDIFGQITLALSFAHERGVIHRDIKPENIFITSDGRVKLGDFGSATEIEGDDSTASTAVGTLRYLAPEQTPSPRADVYALGIVGLELFGERLPESGLPFAGAKKRRFKRRRGRAPLLIRTILLRCTDLDPQQRYPSAVELRDAILQALSASAVTKLTQGLRQRATSITLTLLLLTFLIATAMKVGRRADPVLAPKIFSKLYTFEFETGLPIRSVLRVLGQEQTPESIAFILAENGESAALQAIIDENPHSFASNRVRARVINTALAYGHVSIARSLLSQGFVPNTEAGAILARDVLSSAIATTNVESVELLLEYVTSFQVNHVGLFPIEYAIYLRNHPSDSDSVWIRHRHNGLTGLAQARARLLEIVRIIARHHPILLEITTPSKGGLITASNWKDLDALEVLITAGANVNRLLENQRTIFYDIAGNGMTEAFKLLAGSANADPNAPLETTAMVRSLTYTLGCGDIAQNLILVGANPIDAKDAEENTLLAALITEGAEPEEMLLSDPTVQQFIRANERELVPTLFAHGIIELNTLGVRCLLEVPELPLESTKLISIINLAISQQAADIVRLLFESRGAELSEAQIIELRNKVDASNDPELSELLQLLPSSQT